MASSHSALLGAHRRNRGARGIKADALSEFEESRSRSERQAPERAGNARAVPGLVWPAQAKVAVGAAHDPSEIEADEVARSVVDALRRTSEAKSVEAPPWSGSAVGALRRVAEPSGIGAEGGNLDQGSESTLRSAAGSGRPLPGALRARLEPAMGADLSAIRLHTDDRATVLNRSMSALAFTHGRDVFFRDGMPDTGAESGMKLLVHELAHTVQQGSAPIVGRSQRIHNAGDPATATGAHRKTADSVQRYLAFDGNRLQGKLSAKGKVMGVAGKSTWDDLRVAYHKYYELVTNSGGDLGNELGLLGAMERSANEWLRKREEEHAKAVKKGTDGKHPESQADQDKRAVIADLLRAIAQERPIVANAQRVVHDLKLPVDLARGLPSNAVQYLLDADKALAKGDIVTADKFLGAVTKALAQVPGADQAKADGVVLLLKSSLMRKNIGAVNPAMQDVLNDPKYQLTNKAEIKAGADKAQSLATNRLKDIDALKAKHADGRKPDAMSEREWTSIQKMFFEDKFQRGTLSNLRGAAGQVRAANSANAEATAADKKMFADLTDEEASAIIGYSTNLYPGFNSPLRKGIHQLAADEAALTKLAVSGLNKMPAFSGQVYRHGQNFPGYAQLNRVGAVVSDMAFLSTAREQKGCVGGGEHHEVLEVLVSKSGRDVSPLSAFGKGEAEVLFKPGTRFVVTKVARRDKYNAWPDKKTAQLANETSKADQIQMVVYKEEQ
jgi:hypothetical protein